MKMKTKTLLLFLFIAISQMILADDIIYLKNGDEIRSTISEISQTEVKYKKANNPTGPQYIINKSDVLMIIYSNGEKEIFKEEINTNTNTSPVLSKNLGKLLYDGENAISYNGYFISNKEYLRIAQQNCPKAYDQFTRGKSLKVAGNTLLSIGTPMTATGIILTALGLHLNDRYIIEELYIPGAVFLSIGSTMMVVGIPLNCVGKYLKKRSFSTFNSCALQTADVPELQFKLNSNGAGLALRF